MGSLQMHGALTPRGERLLKALSRRHEVGVDFQRAFEIGDGFVVLSLPQQRVAEIYVGDREIGFEL